VTVVVDASAVVAALIGSDARSEAVRDRLARAAGLAAPHLLDPEVLNALRRITPKGRGPRLDGAVADFLAMPIDRYPHHPLVPRIWELRANATAYDATYLALAEALEMPLLTLDERLARTPGHRADVALIGLET
jgi:predicted nucleic acid-binding protein